MSNSENKKCPKCNSDNTSKLNFGEKLLMRCNECDFNFSL